MIISRALTPNDNKTDPLELLDLIEYNFVKSFADFFFISYDRLANVTVEFIGPKTLATHDEVVEQLGKEHHRRSIRL